MVGPGIALTAGPERGNYAIAAAGNGAAGAPYLAALKAFG